MVRNAGPPPLYDTNILIDYLAGVEAARQEITRHTDPAISIITWMEVLAGVPAQVERPVRSFLTTFTHLPLSPEVAERAVRIRKASRIKLPDAIILATAQVHHRVLVTRNTRDFPVGKEGIRIPYKL